MSPPLFKGSRAYPFAYIAMFLGAALSFYLGDPIPFTATAGTAVAGIFGQNMIERRYPKAPSGEGY